MDSVISTYLGEQLMKNAGIVGAGVMGRVVAQKLIEAKYHLTIYDEYGPSSEKARQMGADIVNNAAAVAQKSDIVLIFLPGPPEVKSCVSGENGLLSVNKPGLIIVDMSTVDPDSTSAMAKAALSKDVGYLDAPVLGRPSTIGKWALPVGGQKEVLERCKSLLENLAAHVIYIGDSGSGNKVKLLNQLMFGAINAMTAEMMAISDAIGVPPKLLYDTITASQAGTVSNLFKELGGRVSMDDYENPTFTVDLLSKDVRLGIQMAKEHKAPPLLAQSIQILNEIAQAQGHGNTDTSIMWKSYESIWGKKNQA